jgi:hypothetical protein
VLVLAAALAASLAACGSEGSSDANEAAGTYRVKVTRAVFPTEQDVGQTSLMRIGVRNTGGKTVPAVTVTVSIAGKEGQTSSLPFAIHDPQPELAQADRPVWVLAEGYPHRGSSPKNGGAETSDKKTFDFGPLKPGKTVEGVWKLSAVKAGRYAVLYDIGAGLSSSVKAETSTGVKPGGSFVVQITTKTPNTVVTDSGQVVEIGQGKGSGK